MNLDFVQLFVWYIYIQHNIAFCSEYIWKDNIIDDPDRDTMEFDMWKRYEFRPELSHGLTNVTILHPGKCYGQ